MDRRGRCVAFHRGVYYGSDRVGPGTAVNNAIYAVAIITLIVLAVVSLFTGFRIAFLPFRLCPFIFGGSAALIVLGAW